MGQEEYSCDICYGSYNGEENFVIMGGCLHYFCKTCLKDYVEGKIGSGDIGRLICPSFTGWKTFMTEINLREIGISEEMIERFNIFSIN